MPHQLLKPLTLVSRSVGAASLDLFLLALVVVWLNHGVYWHGARHLTHGADLRRAGLAAAFFFAWLYPQLLDESAFLRLGRAVYRALLVSRIRWVALGLVTLSAIFLAIHQTLALRYPMYDVGIFHQILWNLAHGNGFHSTVSRAGDFLLDHLSPALALLTPVYWVSGSNPLTLGVIEPFFLFGGVAAWLYLAERIPGVEPGLRAELAAATLVFGASFDSLWGNLAWGFHETSIAFFALSWAFSLYFAKPARSVRRSIAVYALFLLAAASKEILLVDVAIALAIWGFFERRAKGGRAWLVALCWASAIALLGVFVWFEQIPHPADKNYFDRYYAYLGHGLGAFFTTLATTPWLVFKNVGTFEIGRYLLTVFLPWLLFPFILLVLASERRAKLFASEPVIWCAAIVPSFLSALLATYPALRRSGFHYVLELWPVLAACTIVWLARRGSKKWIWAWAILALFMMDRDPWSEFREYNAEAKVEARARQAFMAIPADDSVTADELSGTWLAGRELVTRWPDLSAFIQGCPQWIVLRGVAVGNEPHLDAWPTMARCMGATVDPRESHMSIVRVGSWAIYHRK